MTDDAPSELASPRDTTRPDAPAARDEVIAELRQDKAYLQAALDRALAQLAAERERSDVLMRVALGRIEALTAAERQHVQNPQIPDAGEDARQAHHDAPGGTAANDATGDALQGAAETLVWLGLIVVVMVTLVLIWLR